MELKLCPFCGGKCFMSFNEIIGDYNNPTPYTPVCINCGCDIGGFETRELATKAWNTRVEQVAVKRGKWISCRIEADEIMKFPIRANKCDKKNANEHLY